MAFTAEEIDYLDTKAESEALRGKPGTAPEQGEAPAPMKQVAKAKGAKGRKATAQAELDEHGDPIPF